jgi:uncharacterized protein (DUF1778 family)
MKFAAEVSIIVSSIPMPKRAPSFLEIGKSDDIPVLSESMARQTNEESRRVFSGKLPFRTTAENHKRIYHAATQEGMSINAWMDRALQKAAQTKLTNQTAPGKVISTEISELMQRDLQCFIRLIDQVQPHLTRQTANDAVIWLSHVDKLIQDVNRLQESLAMPCTFFSAYLTRTIMPELVRHKDLPPERLFLILLARMFDAFAQESQSDKQLDSQILTNLIHCLWHLKDQLKSKDIPQLFELLLQVSQQLETLEDR